MGRLPFMQFFPSDYLQDTETIPFELQGIWMRLICLMWIAPERGVLEWSQGRWLHFLGTAASRSDEIWKDLITSELGDFGTNGHGDVTIKSRRMVREEAERKQARERQSRKRHGDVTDDVTDESRRIYQKSDTRSQNSGSFLKKETRTGPASPDPSGGHSSSENSEPEKRFKKEVTNEVEKPAKGVMPSDVQSMREQTPDRGLLNSTTRDQAGGSASGQNTPQPERRSGLDLDICAAADVIYNLDPKKFARLVVWIKQAEKANYKTPAIVKALRDFERYAAGVNGEWWGYLDKLIEKADKQLSSSQSEAEHSERKAAEAQIPPALAKALRGVH